jgi:hypothetical protein
MLEQRKCGMSLRLPAALVAVRTEISGLIHWTMSWFRGCFLHQEMYNRVIETTYVYNY